MAQKVRLALPPPWVSPRAGALRSNRSARLRAPAWAGCLSCARVGTSLWCMVRRPWRVLRFVPEFMLSQRQPYVAAGVRQAGDPWRPPCGRPDQ